MATLAAPACSKRQSWISEINLPIVLGVVAVSALGGALRFHELGLKPLWLDEGLSLGCAQLSWHDSLALAMREPVQWPFYLALKFSLLFGNSEAMIRLPSALFMIAAIPMLFLAARRFVGDIAALIASTLLAVNSEMVKYAQEARSYGLEIFLIIASLYFLCDFVEQPSRRRQISYVLICVLAVYTHMYAALVISAQGLSLFALPDFPRRRWLETYAAIVALTIPMWVFVVRIPARETYSMPPVSATYVYGVLQQLCGNGGGLLVLLYSTVFAAAVVGAILIVKFKGRSQESWASVLPVLWVSLPILITLTAHSLGKPSFGERYMLICLPGLVIGAGALLAPLRRPALILALVLLLGGLGLNAARGYYRHHYAGIFEDYPELAGFIGANARSDDGIVFYWSRMEILYRYYMDRLPPSRFQRPTTIYPVPGSVEPLKIVPSDGPMQLRMTGHPRLWFAVHRYATERGDPEIQQFRAAIEKEFHMEDIREFRTWTVVLYVRNSPRNSRN